MAALLSACTVGPDYERPKVQVPVDYKEGKGWKRAEPRDHLIGERWWEVFKDPQLNRLVSQVAIGNQSVAQAEAQYRQAQGIVQSAQAAYFPTAGLTGTANRFRASSGQSVAVPGVRYLFSAAANIAWEPDLWGSVRRQVESDTANAQASAGTLQALKLSTEATLAQDYFSLRALDTQRKLLDETVAAFEKTLKLTENRYSVGVAARTDVVQAESQLESARAQSIHVGVQRAQMEHAVAVLTGRAPAELAIKFDPLSALPPPIPVGVPSDLLERRPDIATAERQMAAANAKIGVAKAAYYPTLNLAASNGYQSNTLSTLFQAAKRYWALGPAAAALTLLDGGARSAQLKQELDAYDASVANYRQIILNGFQEVEDNVAALRILQDEYSVQEKAVAAARQSVAMTLNQYKAGTVSYLNVMTAQTVALTSEIALAQLLGERFGASVLLVKALGGGWHASRLPSDSDARGEVKWTDFLPFPTR